MAGYRPIYKRIWNDPDFLELNKDEKLLFIYLCTNDATSQSGIFPMSPRTAANETGIPIDYVAERFSTGFYKNVVYDKEHKLIFVKKLRRHSVSGGRPELLIKSIQKDLSNYPSDLLWPEFIKEYPEMLTVIKGLDKGLPTVRQGLETSNNNIIIKKQDSNTVKDNSTLKDTSTSISTSISKERLDKGLPTVDQRLGVSDNGSGKKTKNKSAMSEVRIISNDG